MARWRPSSPRGHRVQVADGQAAMAELPDASVGAVVLLHVLEHLADADLATTIAEAHRVRGRGACW